MYFYGSNGRFELDHFASLNINLHYLSKSRNSFWNMHLLRHFSLFSRSIFPRSPIGWFNRSFWIVPKAFISKTKKSSERKNAFKKYHNNFKSCSSTSFCRKENWNNCKFPNYEAFWPFIQAAGLAGASFAAYAVFCPHSFLNAGKEENWLYTAFCLANYLTIRISWSCWLENCKKKFEK